MVPLITNAQFLTRFDGRWVGKNILDDGTAASITDLLNTSSTAGARLEQLITDASEEFMSAARIGARYTEDDVRTYGGNLVLKVVSGLTIGPILNRRMRAVSDEDALNKAYTESQWYIEQLRRGERILFNVPNVPEAGLPKSVSMNPKIGACPNLWTRTAGRFFGNAGPNGCC